MGPRPISATSRRSCHAANTAATKRIQLSALPGAHLPVLALVLRASLRWGHAAADAEAAAPPGGQAAGPAEKTGGAQKAPCLALFKKDPFYRQTSSYFDAATPDVNEQVLGVARGCVAGTFDGVAGRFFLARIDFEAFLMRTVRAEYPLGPAVQSSLRSEVRGPVGVCVPSSCINVRAVVWHFFWQDIKYGKFEHLLPSPEEGEVALEQITPDFPALENFESGQTQCRTFLHFNALLYISALPREDPLFLGPAETLEDCFKLVGATPTGDILLYVWARLDNAEFLCFGGAMRSITDANAGPHRSWLVHNAIGRPSSWTMERGAVTMVCAFQESPPAMRALVYASGPCLSSAYESWQCCIDEHSCGPPGLLGGNASGLRVDIEAVERAILQVRKPRAWVSYWKLGTLYADLAETYSHSDPQFVRASAQAARWMELAQEVVQDTTLITRYQLHQMRHWNVLYQRARTRDLGLPSGNVTVAVLFTVFGSYGVHCRATLFSLLVHTTAKVAVLIAGDTEGIAHAKSALEMLTEWAGPRGVLARMHFFDLSENAAFKAAWQRLPPEFQARSKDNAESHGGFDASDWARLFLDSYMPQWVHRVIYLDVGDVLVLGDISQLWAFFDNFGPEQVFGAARMPWTLIEYKQWRRLFNASFVAGGAGFNNGVLLVDVRRARQTGYADAFVASMWGMPRNVLKHHGGSMRVMDIQNLFLGKQPRQFFEIPCAWNYMPKAKFEARWGAPSSWPEGMWHFMVSHPGLVAPNHMEHRCAPPAELFSALSQSATEDTMPIFSTQKMEHSRGCRCGERVEIMHAAGAIKLRPWVSNLLGHWGVPFVAGTASVLSWQQHGHGGVEPSFR